MILVTGGTGLLGSHLIYELLKKELPVRATFRSEKSFDEVKKVFGYSHDNPGELFQKIEWVKADILNYEEVYPCLEGVKQVYHCAAMVSFDPSKKNLMIRNNTTATRNMVNASMEHKVERFIHVSSTAAIGRVVEGEEANEKMILNEEEAITGYSISKYRSEMEVWRGMEEGLNAAIVNPSIILGPGFWNSGSSSLFTKVDQGMKFYSYGVTGYVGIDDVISVMMQLMDSKIQGERFLVTSENLTYREIFDMMADALGRKRPSIEGTLFMSELAWRLDWIKSRILQLGSHTFTKERVRAARHVMRFDNSKVKKALSIEFTPVKEVVEEVAQFYKAEFRKD